MKNDVINLFLGQAWCIFILGIARLYFRPRVLFGLSKKVLGCPYYNMSP